MTGKVHHHLSELGQRAQSVFGRMGLLASKTVGANYERGLIFRVPGEPEERLSSARWPM